MKYGPEFCDVTLVCEEELQFEAHGILLANSNKFVNTCHKSETSPSIDLFERVILFFIFLFYGLKCIDLFEKLYMVKFDSTLLQT